MALKFKIQYINSNNESKTIINSSEEKFNSNLRAIAEKNFTLVKKCKLYPIGMWEKYQHVFYNANDRAWVAVYEAQENGTTEELAKAIEWRETVEEILSKFDCGYKDASGMVYVEYPDYKLMKDIIGAYAWRHNGRV